MNTGVSEYRSDTLRATRNLAKVLVLKDISSEMHLDKPCVQASIMHTEDLLSKDHIDR